jgi:tetratricopeptide (TPR) repeat protein
MSPRPAIFISAVSRELKTARQIVANNLTFLGSQPRWQETFSTESGDLRAILRRQIDQCKGVVQLVGQCYGREAPMPDEEFGRVSYTQYEALYAQQRGKKVWYFLIDETFPVDPHDPEPVELRELQAAYWDRLQSGPHLFHPLTSEKALEASVLKLRDDVTHLRRGVKRWAAVVIGLLIFVSGVAVWLALTERRQTAVIKKESGKVDAVLAHNQKMEQAFVNLADVDARSRQPPDSKVPLDEQRASAYAFLEKDVGLPAGTMARELPGFALERLNRSDVPPLMRARAAYALGRFEEAEKLGLASAVRDQRAFESAQRVEEDQRRRVIEGYELASQSAEKRGQYADAMKHLREAEKLTDRDRSPLDWAKVQHAIAIALIFQSHFQTAEDLARSVIAVRTNLSGPKNPDTLRSRYVLAEALYRETKLVEADAIFRELIKLQEEVLGPDDPDTWLSRGGLARVFVGEGKFSEAEALFREQVKFREKELGPAHFLTLRSRGSLAVALDLQGRYAEAEAQYRNVLRLQEKKLGPEHAETLVTRANLAHEFINQERYADAEAAFRELTRLNEKALEPDHVHTLMSRGNLALALNEQGKYAEAEAIFRELIRTYDRILPANHQTTLASRHYLAKTLAASGKHAEAEALFREVIRIQEEKLESNHPDTLESCYDYASELKQENKLQEAKEFARRAAEGARNVMNPDHPDRQRYEKLWAELKEAK